MAGSIRTVSSIKDWLREQSGPSSAAAKGKQRVHPCSEVTKQNQASDHTPSQRKTTPSTSQSAQRRLSYVENVGEYIADLQDARARTVNLIFYTKEWQTLRRRWYSGAESSSNTPLTFFDDEGLSQNLRTELTRLLDWYQERALFIEQGFLPNWKIVSSGSQSTALELMKARRERLVMLQHRFKQSLKEMPVGGHTNRDIAIVSDMHSPPGSKRRLWLKRWRSMISLITKHQKSELLRRATV